MDSPQLEPWAIWPPAAPGCQPSNLQVVSLEAAKERSSGRPPIIKGEIAHILIEGVIDQRSSWFGGVSTEAVGRQFDEAISNPDIKAVLMEVDSPGGSVFGVEELAAKIYAARGTKPIVAVANAFAASAAYWIGVQADELVVTPSGQVGSIGVIAVHADFSGRLEQDGVKVTVMTTAPKKASGNPFQPLAEEAQADIQARLTNYHRSFVAFVGRARETDSQTVETTFGQGGIVGAHEAVDRGMADRVATFEDVVAGMRTGRRIRRPRAMAAKLADRLASTPACRRS